MSGFKEKLKAIANDAETVPNGFTLARLFMAPKVAADLQRDNNWFQAMLFLATDKADGFLARLEDRHEMFRKLGFRRSIVGEKVDPAADKFMVTLLLNAGVKSGVMPRAAADFARDQKTLAAARAVNSAAHGYDIKATEKTNEFRTICGYALPFIAESVENPVGRAVMRYGGLAIGLHGTGEALGISDRVYSEQAREQAEQAGRSYTENSIAHGASLLVASVGVGAMYTLGVEMTRHYEQAQ